MKTEIPNLTIEEGDCKVGKVVILGGGTAALLTAVAFARHLPSIQIVLVRSTKMGIIGVGEGTIATIGRFLHDYLAIDPLRFHQQVHPSIKLGIQFLWGSEKPYHYSFAPQFSSANPVQGEFAHPLGDYCGADARFANLAASLMYHGNVTTKSANGTPDPSPRFAYHIENRRFVKFLENWAKESGVKTVDAVVENVRVTQKGVDALYLDSGEKLTGDLFLDCSGFRSELLGTALTEPFVSFQDALPCDRAVVGGWRRTDEPYNAFTTAEAMESGWCWQIEHDEIINRGYVYASDFVSDDSAQLEFRNKNPRLKETRVIHFRSGFYRRSWVKNVVAIGNAAGFVEPLEATAIGFMSTAIYQLVSFLKTSKHRIAEVHRDLFNRHQERNWFQTRDFLALHYRVNNLSQSSFWDTCRSELPLGGAQQILDYYKVAGTDFRALQPTLQTDIFGPEGYLSILVGQQVPCRRPRNVASAEREAWNRWMRNCSVRGERGVKMEDYLACLRRGDIRIGLG